MDILNLYELAKQENIEVLQYPLHDNGSLSFMSNNGCCYIGIDGSVQDGNAKERVHMGHELGHCMTGSFYNRYSNLDCRQKHENRADKWAVLHLITADALDDAVAAGCTEIWELAEHFGVTEPFMRKAICYYVHGNLATELYF